MKYDFLFYISIFVQCFTIKLVQKVLLIFDPNKIKGMGKLSEKQIMQLKNILHGIEKYPKRIYVESEEYRKETAEIFYSIALFFYLNFQKDKIHEIFENEIDINFWYNKLEYFKNFFKDLILPENEVINLIENVTNYNQILSCLFYIGKDPLKFFDILLKKKELILKLYKKEINEVAD